MLNALTILVGFQFVGEVIARGLSLPLPGPVIGLLLLLGVLAVRYRQAGDVPTAFRSTGTSLLSHLSLLFVPAGVGVMTQLGTLSANIGAVTGAILLSTLAGLLVTGWVMQRLARPDA